MRTVQSWRQSKACWHRGRERPIWEETHRRLKWVKPLPPGSRVSSDIQVTRTPTVPKTAPAAGSSPMSLTLARSDLMCSHNFIAGEWRDSCAGHWHDVSDPATGAVFARVPDSSSADAKEAIDAAHAAFDDWRALTARARAQLLKRWHALIVANTEDLARL